MNRYHKLSGFPRNVPFFLAPDPNQPEMKLSRVFPRIRLTTAESESLVFFCINLFEVTDILIYNHGYSEETFKSTLCYIPCNPDMIYYRENEFHYHKTDNISCFRKQMVKNTLEYYAILEFYRNRI